jgi:hypothetical protein
VPVIASLVISMMVGRLASPRSSLVYAAMTPDMAVAREVSTEVIVAWAMLERTNVKCSDPGRSRSAT